MRLPPVSHRAAQMGKGCLVFGAPGKKGRPSSIPTRFAEFATPEEQANVIVFLCTEDASFHNRGLHRFQRRAFMA